MNTNDSNSRIRLAEDSSTEPEILVQLVQDEDPLVRQALISNRALPPLLLHLLANDVCPDVRFSVAEDPATPVEVLIWLTGDENPYVAARAEKTLEAAEDVHSQTQGETTMAASNLERTINRMLRRRKQLTKNDALRVRNLVIADGYVSRTERKVITQAMQNDLLDDDAFAVMVEVLLHKNHLERAIA